MALEPPIPWNFTTTPSQTGRCWSVDLSWSLFYFQEYCSHFTHYYLDLSQASQSAQRHADFMDKYHHGRASRPKPGRGTRGPWRHEQTSAKCEKSHDNPGTHSERADICDHHSHGNIVGLLEGGKFDSITTCILPPTVIVMLLWPRKELNFFSGWRRNVQLSRGFRPFRSQPQGVKWAREVLQPMGRWVGACNSLIFLWRRFQRPIYF